VSGKKNVTKKWVDKEKKENSHPAKNFRQKFSRGGGGGTTSEKLPRKTEDRDSQQEKFNDPPKWVLHGKSHLTDKLREDTRKKKERGKKKRPPR